MGRLRSRQQDEAETEPEAASASSDPVKGYTGTGDHIDDYGDQSTSYWPPGWNFERYRNSKQADLFALPQDQLTKLLSGLHEVLGEAGNLKLARALGAHEDERENQAQQGEQPSTAADPSASSPTSDPPSEARPPNWLKSYQRFNGQGWGFVVFKTGTHEDHRWQEYQEKFNEIIRLPFRNARDISGVEEAEGLFSIRWVEDDRNTDAEIQGLQDEFEKIKPTLSPSTPTQLFFVATPQSVSHVLQEPVPGANAAWWRPDPPYILAVSSVNELRSGDDDDDDDGGEIKVPVRPFKVAIETIVEELWVLLATLSWPAGKVSRGIKETPWVAGSEAVAEETAASDQDDRADVWWTSAPPPSSMRTRRRVR